MITIKANAHRAWRRGVSWQVVSRAAPLPFAARARADMVGLKNCVKERSHRSLRPARPRGAWTHRAICAHRDLRQSASTKRLGLPQGATSELGYRRHDVGRGKTYAADPTRHFGTANCRSAKGPLNHLVGMAKSGNRMLRPKAFAVLRLITSSNLVGCWIGSSLPFVPPRGRYCSPSRCT